MLKKVSSFFRSNCFFVRLWVFARVTRKLEGRHGRWFSPPCIDFRYLAGEEFNALLCNPHESHGTSRAVKLRRRGGYPRCASIVRSINNGVFLWSINPCNFSISIVIEIDERNKFVLRIVTMEDFKKNSERKEYFPIFHSNKRENVFVGVKFVNREEFLIEPFFFN